LGDLGFGDEIVAYRWQIWLGLIVLSIIGVLIYEVVKDVQKISSLSNQVEHI